jgi:hypothetical protein
VSGFVNLKQMETGRERFKFGAADCEAIIHELSSVDWRDQGRTGHISNATLVAGAFTISHTKSQ